MKLVCLRVSFGFSTWQVLMYFSKFSRNILKNYWPTIPFFKTRFKVFLHLGFWVSGCGFLPFWAFFLSIDFFPLLSWSFYFLSPSSFPLFFFPLFLYFFFSSHFFFGYTHMHNRLHMLSCFFSGRFIILKRNVI